MAQADGRQGEGRWRAPLLLGGLVLLVLAANLGGAWLVDVLGLEAIARGKPIVERIIMGSVVVYALLMAIPFVPGIEIGLALLVVVGPAVAALVYGATVLGLFLSFLIGYFVPQGWLKSIFAFLRLAKARRLVEDLEPLGRKERLALLVSRAPRGIVPPLLRHRYLALALVLNIPGNALIGGGGGISLVAGLSRLYSPPAFLVTLALAVSPVPLAVFFLGREVLVG